MPLLPIIITLIVIGILLGLVNIIPMDGQIKRIIHTIVIIAVVIWLLKVFGIWSYLINNLHAFHT